MQDSNTVLSSEDDRKLPAVTTRASKTRHLRSGRAFGHPTPKQLSIDLSSKSLETLDGVFGSDFGEDDDGDDDNDDKGDNELARASHDKQDDDDNDDDKGIP